MLSLTLQQYCVKDLFKHIIKMKTVICLLALSAVLTQSAVLDRATARQNLNIGSIAPGNRLLARSYLYRPAVANTIQSEDFAYRGNTSTWITAIQATEVGYTQWANIFIVAGGLNQHNVTLRAQSLRGYGYYYLIDIWGR